MLLKKTYPIFHIPFSIPSRGASMLEMLFAVAITLFAMPFAYRQITIAGDDIKTIGIAKRIVDFATPAKNFIRLYSGEFIEGEIIEIKTDVDETALFVTNISNDIVGFIVSQSHRNDIMRAHKIANAIGLDAAVVGPDGLAYNAGGNWAIMIPDGVHGDVVYRIRSMRIADDSVKYLHRTVLSEGELSTMKRDLSLGGFSMVNVNTVSAEKLNSADVDAFLVKTPVIATDALYFAEGLNLNPEKTNIPLVRANGDAIGFRNFFTDEFSSPKGMITSDRAAVTRTLHVLKKFEVKAPYSRTISGFAGISAANVRTSYLDTTNLTFLPGFGLTVSSELLYSDDPPIKLGSWSFPNENGNMPRLSQLRLDGIGRIEMKTPDFSEVLKAGWR